MTHKPDNISPRSFDPNETSSDEYHTSHEHRGMVDSSSIENRQRICSPKQYIISNNLHYEMNGVGNLTRLLNNVDSISIYDIEITNAYLRQLKVLRDTLNKYINTLDYVSKTNNDLQLFKLTNNPIIVGFIDNMGHMVSDKEKEYVKKNTRINNTRSKHKRR